LMPSTSNRQNFQHEVAGRFGLVPNFFSSAPDAPEIIEELWDFAKAAYLDNPDPISLQREALRLPLVVLRDALLHRSALRIPGRAGSLLR
jgi:hypothetical protein